MNSPAVSALPAAQTLKVNQIVIQGRIDHVSKFEDKFEHVVLTPAPDEYSKPSYMRVNSSSRLGQKGDDVKVLCTFNGWPNNYTNKNNEMVHDVKGFFIAVE